MKLYEMDEETGDIFYKNKVQEFIHNVWGWMLFLFCWDTWTWLLAEPSHDEVTRWEAFKCRWQGHPCGWIYYNPGALEPDDRCKNCYDRIG